MDWHLYIYSFLAGLIGVNGIPHFIKGVTGQVHQTPFGRPSSAVVNVIWGWVNFVVAGLLIYWAQVHAHLLRAFSLVVIAGLIMGILLALTWTKHPEYNKINEKSAKK